MLRTNSPQSSFFTIAQIMKMVEKMLCTKKHLPSLKPASPLLCVLLTSGLAAQDPFALAMHVCLVLDGNAAKMAEDVLHLCISMAAGVAAEVIDRLHAGKDVVDHGNDDDNANGVAPDHNSSDDASLSAVVITLELIFRMGEEFVFTSREPA